MTGSKKRRAMATVGQIARRFSVPVHRVEYVVRANDIAPDGWAGNARVFHEREVVLIGQLLAADRVERDEGPVPSELRERSGG